MTYPTAVLLFAAGMGTRMAPLTFTTPKPMIEVAGKPLLDHALDQCAGMRTVVNVHYLADQIRDHLKGTSVIISDETGDLLETGGGLKKALPLLRSDPAITLNTDAVWKGRNPVSALLEAWVPDAMDALLLLVPTKNATAHTGAGDFDLDANGRISRGQSYVYSGVQIIRTHGLSDISTDAFSMWALWSGMLDQGTMFGAVYDGKWCDVGRPENIHHAETMLKEERDV